MHEVLARLRGEGPLTANQLGGAKKGGPWWDWSEAKIAAEWLLDIGDFVCRERRGFARVYDLAERAIPTALLAEDWTDEECAVRLVAAAGRSMGVATEADLAVYHGVPRPLVRRVLEASGLKKVSVAGWAQPAYADPGALSAVGTRMRGRTVLLSPFDSLIWYRDRVEHLFDVRHRLEAYTPKEKRIYGYFAMPVLDGTRMVGVVDPGQAGRCAGRQAGDAAPARDAAAPVARALAEAASWVGCTGCDVAPWSLRRRGLGCRRSWRPRSPAEGSGGGAFGDAFEGADVASIGSRSGRGWWRTSSRLAPGGRTFGPLAKATPSTDTMAGSSTVADQRYPAAPNPGRASRQRASPGRAFSRLTCPRRPLPPLSQNTVLACQPEPSCEKC